MPTPPVNFPESGRVSGRKYNGRGLILLAVTILGLFGFYHVLIHPAPAQQELTQAQLFNLIKAGKVVTLVNEPDPATGIRYLTGTYRKPVSSVPGATETGGGAFKVAVDLQLDPYFLSEITQAGYKGTIETRNNSSILWPVLLQLLTVVLSACVGVLALVAAVWIVKFAWRHSPGDVK